MIGSVKGRLSLGICAIVALYVILSWTLNGVFLDDYYYYVKRNALIQQYREIYTLYRGDPEELLTEFETLERTEGLHITVTNSEFAVKYVTALGRDNWNRYLQERLVLPETVRPTPPLFERIRSTALELKGGYEIVGFVRDDRLKMDFISLTGKLANGDYLFLHAPVTPIQESVVVANRFFLVIGLVMIAIGSVFAFAFSARFTKPILDMKAISQRMAGLDFSTKYPVTSRDEIGELGESINLMSEQLEQSLRKLEQANEKLKEDIERERKIDEMRKEFIANVSHELKTPIAVIQGYAEGLKLNVNDDEESRSFYCDVIMDESAKMNRLVRQLLGLAQIESGYVKPEKTTFDILEMTERILKKNQVLLREKGVNISIEGQGPLCVRADANMIEQVLTNYLTNAIDHVDESSRISLRLETRGDKVRVSVFNAGEQIPPESLEAIWTSFYKVDKARTRAYGGTGLGLTIVKAIMDAHGNAYGVENRPDGVEFWFEMDAREDGVNDAEARHEEDA